MMTNPERYEKIFYPHFHSHFFTGAAHSCITLHSAKEKEKDKEVGHYWNKGKAEGNSILLPSPP